MSIERFAMWWPERRVVLRKGEKRRSGGGGRGAFYRKKELHKRFFAIEMMPGQTKKLRRHSLGETRGPQGGKNWENLGAC